jgi:predicted esterase
MSFVGTIYFAHGKESGPQGLKIAALTRTAERRGLRVESPDYTGLDDPDERVRRLLSLHPVDPRCLILAGSSMGAYVSAAASARLKPAGLFLMAPAFYRPGYAQPDPEPHAALTVLVHGWQDTVIPPDASIRYAREHGAELHLIIGDHRLNEQIETVAAVFDDFLRRVLMGVA